LLKTFPPPLAGFFNWTMTYRLDSDIPNPYGFFAPRAAGFAYPPSTSNPIQWQTFNRTQLR
jgi:hypothetical protein